MSAELKAELRLIATIVVAFFAFVLIMSALPSSNAETGNVGEGCCVEGTMKQTGSLAPTKMGRELIRRHDFYGLRENPPEDSPLWACFVYGDAECS